MFFPNQNDARKRRTEALLALMEACVLCPRQCRVNRLQGEKGFCSLGSKIIVSRVLPHFGEEPPISGNCGAGTIFFSSCNLRCSFCQNRQISHKPQGETVSVEALAERMLGLKAQRCHNIEAVTPTPQVPLFVKALDLAAGKGLDLPIIYNCGGYENPDIIRMLEGIVDIYLPDFKYSTGKAALEFSGVIDYPQHALASIREMVRQCGADLIMEGEIAVKGVIIRHLVLPGQVENSRNVLKTISRDISTAVPVSIMSQYTPTGPIRNHPSLGRRITREEYDTVVEYALDLGFETLFTQDVDERALTPDFDRDEPFEFR
jgi:putative pyruvate formate lyase activating enzyme